MYKRFKFNKISTFIVLVALSSIALFAQNLPHNTITREGQTFYEYKVKPGEGLYGIARAFSVSQDVIIQHNPDAKIGLKSGQTLYIPAAKTGVATDNSSAPETSENTKITFQQPINQNHTFLHTVARGETLFSISQMYRTSVNEIIRYNTGLTEKIEEGQTIVIPQTRSVSAGEPNYRYHTIAPKETLYSVSRTYSLKPEDLIAANQGLSVETFRIGTIIRVPIYESGQNFTPYREQTKNIIHKVQKKETLSSIARKYKVDVEDIKKNNPILSAGLRVDMELMIPQEVKGLDENFAANEARANTLLRQNNEMKNVNVIKIGLLLPFLEKGDNQNLRLQEYYEGFLIAVERLKNQGANIELYVFDIGTKSDTRKLESLLGTMEMQDLHLLIGGLSEEQIKILADFAQKHKVKYVIPFSSKNELVQRNGYIFQVNAPQSYLYSKASDAFMGNFRNENVVIVNADSKNDKSDFITILKNDLRKNRNASKELSLTNNLSTEILPLLQNNKGNIIVPSTGDSGSIRQMIEALDKVRQNHPEYVIRLFGYPEWQTYSASISHSFHKYGAYFYSAFYADEGNADTKLFVDDFKKWYKRDLINTYPKYGMLGYDTGLYFMTALHRYGLNFEQRVSQIKVNTVQFAFNFERVNNWGGFINTGLYLVHYDTNGVVTKIDKSK